MKASIYASVLQTVLMAAGVLAVVIKVDHDLSHNLFKLCKRSSISLVLNSMHSKNFAIKTLCRN